MLIDEIESHFSFWAFTTPVFLSAQILMGAKTPCEHIVPLRIIHRLLPFSTKKVLSTCIELIPRNKYSKRVIRLLVSIIN